MHRASRASDSRPRPFAVGVLALIAPTGGADRAIARFTDLVIQDGSSFAIKPALADVFPGRFTAIEPAAVEVHATYSGFADEVSDDVVQAIAKRRPLRAVFKDSGFASDAARINAEQIFREVSPETEVRTI